jgi:ubiquinone/menaquinone biosynthesis C-methylase UbiE
VSVLDVGCGTGKLAAAFMGSARADSWLELLSSMTDHRAPDPAASASQFA